MRHHGNSYVNATLAMQMVSELLLRHSFGPHVVISVPSLVSRSFSRGVLHLDTREGTLLARPGPSGLRSGSPLPH
jgi:hypothetical protein